MRWRNSKRHELGSNVSRARSFPEHDYRNSSETQAREAEWRIFAHLSILFSFEHTSWRAQSIHQSDSLTCANALSILFTAMRGLSNWQISYVIEDKDVFHNMATQFLPNCSSKNADPNTSTNLLVDLSPGFVDILHALPRTHFFVDMTWIPCPSYSCCLIGIRRDRSCNLLFTLSPYNLCSIPLNLYDCNIALIACIIRWVH